jgi:peptidoglycan/LPS O-acetylase OafA/YrhL
MWPERMTAPSRPAIGRPLLASGTTGRIPELDGLRGVAILLVLMFHLGGAVTLPRSAQYVVLSGWLGVDLFFVLSGYLITGILVDSAGRPGYYRNFISRRTLRIFPLYYAVLAIAYVTSYGPSLAHWSSFLQSRDWWYAVYIGNIQVFLRNQWPSGDLTPLWSLQVEEQFYLTFPLLVALVTRRMLARVLAGAVIAALLIRITMVWAMPGNIAGTYVLMPCRMDTLALGGLVAVAQRDSASWLRSRWIAPITACTGAIVVWICWRYGSLPWSTAMRTAGFSSAAVFFTGVLILLIHRRNRVLLAIFRLRPLTWIGVISYGVYLLHIPAAEQVRRFAPRVLHVAPGGFAEAFLSLAAVIAAASVSWRFFESPILRMRNRFTHAMR